MSHTKVIVIGVSGASASGKSLLSSTIVEEVGNKKVAVISEDSYYKDLSNLPKAVRDTMNFDHPDSLDHKLLIEHLKSLQQSKSIDIPQYDHTTHTRKKTTTHLNNHLLIVLEGILLFTEPELRDLMDIKIFVDTPLDICLLRRLKRDILERDRSVESVLQQYMETVRPMYLQFIEPSKRYADLIIPRGGKNRIAIDLIKTKIHHLINSNSQS